MGVKLGYFAKILYETFFTSSLNIVFRKISFMPLFITIYILQFNNLQWVMEHASFITSSF